MLNFDIGGGSSRLRDSCRANPNEQRDKPVVVSVNGLHNSNAGMAQVNDSLLKLVREVLDLPSDHPLEDSVGPGDVPGWDSLGTLRLVDAAEERFGVEFELEEIAEFKSIAHFRRMIEKHLGT